MAIDLGDLGDRGIQFFGLNDSDRFGAGYGSSGSIGGGDFNGDGIADLYFGSLLLQTEGVTTGGGYVVLGSRTGIDTDLNNAFLSFHGGPDQVAGAGISSAGDVNGDGFDDLVTGDGDSAFVILGRAAPPSGDIDLASIGDDGFMVFAAPASDALGYSVLGAGDVDGDGLDDFIVGAFLSDTNGDNAGAAALIFGRTLPMNVNFDSLGTRGVSFVGTTTDQFVGDRLATGDVNGDGLTDLLFGTVGTSSRVGIVLGTDPVVSSPVEITTDADVVLDPAVAGQSAVAVGDFNGDGQDDVIVGVGSANLGGADAGAVFGRSGPVASSAALGANDEILRGDGDSQFVGNRVRTLGDVNGDGVDDLIVGTRNDQAIVLFGRSDFFTPGTADPIVDADAIAPTVGFVINGAAPQRDEGASVNGPGDVNGDGLNDILVGPIDTTGVIERVSLIYGAFAAPSSAAGDSLTSGFQSDSISGGDGDDTIFGNGGDDTLLGEDGADLLAGGDDNDSVGGGAGADNGYGQDGNDTLAGGGGDDNLRGNVGNDLLLGEADDDTLRGHLDDDTLVGDTGDDLLYGGAANDSLNGGLGNDTLNGNSGNDTILGGDGDDLLRGQAGADSILGGVGNDTLRGMQGFDMLFGEGGDDFLSGGPADDTLTGGAGADIFEFAQFQGGDVVTDFDLAADLMSFVGFSFADLAVSDSGDGARITIAAEGDSPTLAVVLTDIQAADVNAGLFVGG